MRGIVEVNLLARGKTIDTEVNLFLHLVFGLLAFPLQLVTVGGPLGLEPLHLGRSLAVDKGISRDKGRYGVVVVAQVVGYTLVILEQRVARPETVAPHVVEVAAQLHLVVQLCVDGIHVGSIHGAHHILPDIEVPTVGMVVPPIDKRLDTSRLVADLPIELRQHVVHPTVTGPQQHIGIELVVVLQAVGRTAVGVALLVTVDTEGADTEAHPGVARLDNPAQLLDEQVHILATPVTPLHTVTIAGVAVIVGKLAAGNRIGIEIVVHVDGIDIVASHNIVDHPADKLAALGQSRVEIELFTILDEPLGMLVIDVRRCQRLGSDRPHPVGIEPGVQLHIAGMALVNQILQRVPHRVGSHPLLPREIFAPRLQLRGIEGVGRRAHLKNHRIDTDVLETVQHLIEIALHGIPVHIAVTALPHRMNPRSTELPFRVLVGPYQAASEANEQQ